MNILKSIAIAFSTFSCIPMPHFEWREENMRYMLGAFPLVGIVSGALMVLWYLLVSSLGFGAFATAVGLFVVPVAVTGGIHLDGYCDVCDALASHAEPERRREILKDPHVGAFALIWLAVYCLVYVGALVEVQAGPAVLQMSLPCVLVLALGQVLSRSLSGLASLVFPLSSQKGMLAAQSEPASKTPSVVALVVFGLAAAVGMLTINILCGALVIVGALVVFFVSARMAKTRFGGMSGDIAGFMVQVCEVVMAVVLAFALRMVV